LPNRVLLFDRLSQAMLQATRQYKAVGLLLLDLDGFKRVNDELGHSAGDVILQIAAARLSKCIRGCDTACRYGGDEFVILLPEVAAAENVRSVAKKIRTALSRPYRLGAKVVVVGVSIGAALFKGGPVSCNELIGAADADMYRSKRRLMCRDERSTRHGLQQCGNLN
jgi:diguanylate cyclase (GGDEF)-like protein